MCLRIQTSNTGRRASDTEPGRTPLWRGRKEPPAGPTLLSRPGGGSLCWTQRGRKEKACGENRGAAQTDFSQNECQEQELWTCQEGVEEEIKNQTRHDTKLMAT